MKSKKKKITNTKKVVIVELVIIFIMVIALIVGIQEVKLGKDKTYKQPIEENVENIEQELETNDIYVVDITEPEQNIVENEPKQNEIQEVKEVISNAKYYIKVNYGAQVVTIYSKDSEGKYTVPVKAMICSTGEYTPKSGVYPIPGRWSWGLMQGNVYGQYVTKITGNILFHSVPYTQQNPATLEYWEYDKLGTAASLGCVRLKVEDAKWIYNNCENGTNVEFYSSPDPGPLGKPTAKKISDYPDYLRNWDPTDPNSSNPWHSYKEENQNTEVTNEVNVIEKNEIENKTKDEQGNNTKNEIKDKETNKIENEKTNEEKNEVENKIQNVLHY